MAELLPHPDQFHFTAAQGWLGLGDSVEAEAELNSIRPELHDHPAVLELRFAVNVHGKRLEVAMQVAERQIAVLPDDPQGWINRGNALFWLKRYREAYDSVVPVLDRFATQWPLRYNLACYCVKLERLDEAKQWIEAAAPLTTHDELTRLSLGDPDLKELWDWVRSRPSPKTGK